MPFGSDPFRDHRLSNNLKVITQSPMPFGSDPFRDRGGMPASTL